MHHMASVEKKRSQVELSGIASRSILGPTLHRTLMTAAWQGSDQGDEHKIFPPCAPVLILPLSMDSHTYFNTERGSLAGRLALLQVLHHLSTQTLAHLS